MWEVHCDGDGLTRAREDLGATLVGWGFGGLVFETQLLLSELVTNAAVHARCATVRVRLVAGRRSVRVEVADPVRDRVPVLVARHPSEVGGLGMRIVAAAAPRWGTTVHEEGKVVWFELPVPASDTPEHGHR